MTDAKWYVGSQNDGLCIINQPPRASGTDVVWAGRSDVQHIACVDGDTFEEKQKNANMLAAAPELLDACKAALKVLRDLHGGVDGLRAGEMLKEAIKKAENKA